MANSSALLATMENKTYITYKSRIKAAERINFSRNVWSTVGIVSSFILIVLSIIRLTNASLPLENEKIDLLIVTLSIQLIVYTTYQSFSNGEKISYDMFNNYQDLHRLHLKILEVQESGSHTQEEIEDINAKYLSILRSTANHSKIDYLRAEFEIKNKTNDPIQFFKNNKYTCLLHYLKTSSPALFLLASTIFIVITPMAFR